MASHSTWRIVPSALLAGLLLFASGYPITAQASPGLVSEERGSEWMWGRSLEEAISQLQVRSIFGNYAPEQLCAMATVTHEGELVAYGVSPEPVRIEDGMSGAEACGPALEFLPGDMLIPDGRFDEGDTLVPGQLFLSSSVFITLGGDYEERNAPELDGFYLADEIGTWAATSMVRKDSGEAHLDSRLLSNPEGPWEAFLIFFVPAEGMSEDFQGQALVVDLNLERMER